MSRIDFRRLLLGFIVMFFLTGCQQTADAEARPTPEPPGIELSPAELTWIGNQIFRNECSAKEVCLVHWNEGEAFPSLGIGHFIWYPAGVEEPFVESFPAMIEHLSAQGEVVPDWLARLAPFDAPWADRDSFIEVADAESVRELRHFLAATKGPQAGFLVRRAKEALGRVLAAAPASDRETLARRLQALISTPGGVYAVIDYVNFKGEGLAATERYKGQGWGLLQVLQAMNSSDGRPALQAFREAAARMLTQRAENADRPIEKERWLPGWLNRLETYGEPAKSENQADV